MQTQQTFIESIRHQLTHGGMTIKLIFINVVVFLGLRILEVFSQLLGWSEGQFTYGAASHVVVLYTDVSEFITHPWGLFTYMFTHFGAWHLIWNMVMLYFAGRLFEQLFNASRLLYTYILGGILGGILEIVAHLIFPSMQMTSATIVGASGSIMAIFIAIAFYRPNLKINLFGILPVRLIILAGIFLLSDIFNLSSSDGTAHFAHLGGAIFGIWSIQNPHSSTNVLNVVQYFIQSLFKKKQKPRFKVKKGGKTTRSKSDADYNLEKKKKQEVIDKILDKISKSGYESLSKKEKDILFNQSKNG